MMGISKSKLYFYKYIELIGNFNQNRRFMYVISFLNTVVLGNISFCCCYLSDDIFYGVFFISVHGRSPV